MARSEGGEGCRVVYGDVGTTFQQPADDVEGGGVAEVVGIGLEGEAENTDCFALEDLQVVLELLDDGEVLALVHLNSGLEQGHGVVVFAARVDQRPDVLAEAAAPPADASAKELRSDPLVEADSPGDLVDIRTYPLAQPGHLVDEADLGGEEGVGRVLDGLGTHYVGGDEGNAPLSLGVGGRRGVGRTSVP